MSSDVEILVPKDLHLGGTMTDAEIMLLLSTCVLMIAYRGSCRRADQFEKAAEVAIEALSDIISLDPDFSAPKSVTLIATKAKLIAETAMVPGGCDDKKT
jgi:hypothetical protein